MTGINGPVLSLQCHTRADGRTHRPAAKQQEDTAMPGWQQTLPCTNDIPIVSCARHFPQLKMYVGLGLLSVC